MSRKYPKNTEIHDLTPAEKSALEHQYHLDHQMVKGIFKNFQQKNSPIGFHFRKYKQDAIKWYPGETAGGKKDYFVDGRTYEIPLMIANHLNERCFREVHQNAQDETGKPLPETIIGKKIHRFGFINTDFRPIAGLKEATTGVSQLVSVKGTLPTQ